MTKDFLDESLSLELLDGHASQGGRNLHAVHQDGCSYEFIGRGLFVDLVICGPVKGDGVVGLILDLGFGPLLLLGLSSRIGGFCGFCLCLALNMVSNYDTQQNWKIHNGCNWRTRTRISKQTYHRD